MNHQKLNQLPQKRGGSFPLVDRKSAREAGVEMLSYTCHDVEYACEQRFRLYRRTTSHTEGEDDYFNSYDWRLIVFYAISFACYGYGFSAS